VPSGNPPSAIAGGYSIIDGSVGLLLLLLARLGIAPVRRRGEAARLALASRATSPGDGGR
jgi:hypothetical protein